MDNRVGLWAAGALLFLLPAAVRSQGSAAPILTRRATVTTGQLLALNATPQSLVPAPGAGKMLVFEGALLYKPAGTAYAGIAAGEDLAISYTNGAGLDVGVCETTGFLDQATAQTRYMQAPPGALAAGTVSDLTPAANAPLVISLLSGEITTGTSALQVRVLYRQLPTTLP